MSEIELKPCPFCNSEKIRDGYIRDGRRIYCADCSASVTAYHPSASESAASLWNSRFDQPRTPDGVSPIARLVWLQGRRAVDDLEDYYEVARPGDKSVDGSDPFPVYASVAASSSAQRIGELEAEIETLVAYREWLRQGFREMSKWAPEEAAERTQQYSRDCLSGPLSSQIEEIKANRRARAALSPEIGGDHG